MGSVHRLIPERPLVKVHTAALSLEIGIHCFNSVRSNQPELKTVLVEEFTQTPAVKTERERTVAPKGCGKRPHSPLPRSAPALSRTCASGHLPVTAGSKTAGAGSQQPVFQAGHRRVTPGLLHGLEAHAPAASGPLLSTALLYFQQDHEIWSHVSE